MATVQFQQWLCEVTFAQYRDGSVAIQLIDDEGPVATATVALDVLPPKGCVWIKDYSENTGMADALIEAKVIEPTPVNSRQSGWVTVKSYRLIN